MSVAVHSHRDAELTRLLLQKLEEMHANLEDLEQLTELNDELELNHLETEKQMQEEIGQSIPQSRSFLADVKNEQISKICNFRINAVVQNC